MACFHKGDRAPEFSVDLTSIKQLSEREDIFGSTLEQLRALLPPRYRENEDMMAQSLCRTASIECSVAELLQNTDAGVELRSFIPEAQFYPSELGVSAADSVKRYSLEHSVVTELIIESVRYSSPVNLLLRCSSHEVFMKHLESTKANMDARYMESVRKYGGLTQFALLPYYAVEPPNPAVRADPRDGLRCWSETTGDRSVALRRPTAYIVDDSLQYYAGCGLKQGEDISRGCVVHQFDPSESCDFSFVPLNSSLAAMLCTYHSALGAQLRSSLTDQEAEQQDTLLLRLPRGGVKMCEQVAQQLLFDVIPYEDPRSIHFAVRMQKADELKRMKDGSLLRKDMSAVHPATRIKITVKFTLRYVVMNRERRSSGCCTLRGRYIPLGGSEYSQLKTHTWMRYGRVAPKEEEESSEKSKEGESSGSGMAVEE